MSLAEGVSARVAYKFYASGVITENALDIPATAPGSSGGQILRRVSLTPALKKNTYQSTEIRSDRQIADFRHGTQHVDGNIQGELSPATYFDFIEAVNRDTRAAGVTLSHTQLTSAAASNSASTFTFGSGDPVALGLFVGDIIRFTDITTTPANNGTNFTVLGFSGTTNETVLVDPAPADQSADTAFSVTRPGHSTIIPSTGLITRKMLLEVYHEDLALARLFQECRLGSYKFNLPATGMATTEFSIMGRAGSNLNGGAAPFFTAPTAETTTGIEAAVNGALLLGGSKIGVITALDITNNLTPTAADVVGQNFAAEIFLGRATVTGNITAYLNGSTILDDFINETELQLMVRLDATTVQPAPSMVIFAPRIKLGSADVNVAGEGGQTLTASFTALKYEGTAPGVANTTLRIMDTEA